MRSPRVDPKRLDLSAFEAWLRAQLAGAAFAAVVIVVMQLVRALFSQNLALRLRLTARGPKPPSERLAALERQLSFVFSLPSNDVAPKPPSPVAEQARENAEGSQAEGDPPEQPPKKPRAPRTPRGPLPKDLARIEVPNPVPEAQRLCGCCGVVMSAVRCRVVETLELIPARIVVHRRVDEVLACPRCDAMACAKAPPSVMDGGKLGPVLVTEALCAKVLDGLPIERQSRNLQRQGAPVTASTLNRSVANVLALLQPLSARVLLRVKQSARVQLDATGLRVLDPKAVKGLVRDTLWVLIGDGRWVHFAALEEGDSESLEQLLRGAEADSFQCDGTSVTNFVETKLQRRRPGCHSHGRRRLVEATHEGDLRALEGLRLYQQLFAIEKDATAQKLSIEARQQLRETHSLPVLWSLQEWVLALAPSVEPRSKLGQALTYLQRQWLRLCLFVWDGALELTNNRSERELRDWTLGQHSWLFMGDQRHAQRWAAAYSLAHSALAQGLNPRAYLHAVVKALLAGHAHTRLDALLPDAMRQTHPELIDPLRRAPDTEHGTGSDREAA